MRIILNKKGFTLLEVLVALFIFLLIMTTVTGIFAKLIDGYRSARSMQKDLENAQYAMNSMAKILRTSEIVSTCSPSPCSLNLLRVYDYSQGKCVEYSFAPSELQMRSELDPGGQPGPTWCSVGNPFGTVTLVSMTTGVVTGQFYVTPSAGSSPGPPSYGKVTIRMEIATLKDKVRLQSSVSLRNKP